MQHQILIEKKINNIIMDDSLQKCHMLGLFLLFLKCLVELQQTRNIGVVALNQQRGLKSLSDCLE